MRRYIFESDFRNQYENEQTTLSKGSIQNTKLLYF